MDLNRNRDMPAARKRAEEAFAARLQASGRERGVFVAKKDADGELLIYDFIGEDFFGVGVKAADVSEKLATLKGVSTLHVHINSPGGNLYEGKTLYNEIKRFPAKKIVHVEGIAASAASLIAMAGDQIVTETGGTWLIHEAACWGVIGRGTADDHRRMANELETENAGILAIYVERTKCPADKFATLMRRDEVIGAAEAKSYGLTDEISEVEEARAKAVSANAAARVGAPISPRARAESARARARVLSEKYPGVRHGEKQTAPGQPAPKTPTSGNAGKGK